MPFLKFKKAPAPVNWQREYIGRNATFPVTTQAQHPALLIFKDGSKQVGTTPGADVYIALRIKSNHKRMDINNMWTYHTQYERVSLHLDHIDHVTDTWVYKEKPDKADSDVGQFNEYGEIGP